MHPLCQPSPCGRADGELDALIARPRARSLRLRKGGTMTAPPGHPPTLTPPPGASYSIL